MPSQTSPTAGDRLTTMLSYGVLVLLAYLVFRIFRPFFVPLAWAAILVIVFYPAHGWFARRMSRTRSAALSTAAVMLLLIAPCMFVLTLFVQEAIVASRGIQQAFAGGNLPVLARAWAWVNEHAPGAAPTTDLTALLRQAAERAAGYLAGQLGTVLRNVATFLLDLFVMLFAMFYLFRDAEGIVAWLRRLLPFEAAHREKMLSEARNLIFASVTTSLLIAAIQGFLGGAAFAIVKLPTPLFWGVCMAFFSLVPAVGSTLIWVPAAIWLLATGHGGRAIVLAAICAGVAGTADNLLRPVLLRGRTQLSGLLIFISVLGGVGVFGMLGLVLGPIVVATAAGILEVSTERTDSPLMSA